MQIIAKGYRIFTALPFFVVVISLILAYLALAFVAFAAETMGDCVMGVADFLAGFHDEIVTP